MASRLAGMDIFNRLRCSLNSAVGTAMSGERGKPKTLWHAVKSIASDALRRADGLPWRTKVIGVLCIAFAVMLMAGPLGVSSRFDARLKSESLERGTALVELLAASNIAAFKDGQDVLFSIEAVSGQSGVLGAYVADRGGMIVTPVELYGKRINDAPGMNYALHERAGNQLKVYSVKGGKYILSYPVIDYVEHAGGLDKEVVGVAYLRYDANAYGWWYAPVEILKFVILAILVAWGCYYLLRRWTLRPIELIAGQTGNYGDSADSTHPIGIRFDELDRMRESLQSVEVVERDDIAVEDVSLDDFWQHMETLDIGAYVVMDANKRVISVSGNSEKLLKCSFERGLHLLDLKGKGPGMDALMKLLVDMDARRNSVAEAKIDNASFLRGMFIEKPAGGAYVISVCKKKRR